MPVYNGGSMYALALGSLTAKGYADFKLVISDNRSTDGTGVG
jgi:glycosyltransferase involved in cell wall biosynthesis